MKLKAGVRLHNLQPQLLLALMTAERVYDSYGCVLTVTSVNDGTHSDTSLHYAGAAADIRVWGLNDPETVTRQIKQALGRHFDVLFEDDHIHIEYQPRRR